jgi:hypothetical protein
MSNVRTIPFFPLAILPAFGLILGCKGAPPAPSVIDDAATPVAEAPSGMAAAYRPEAVASATNPNSSPTYSGPTGSVEGTITVTGDPAPGSGFDFSKCPDAERIYGKTFREGAPLPDGSRPLADALVVITGYAGFVIAEKNPVKRVTFEGCAFSARTIDLTFGQQIAVSNKDAKLHAPQIDDNVLPALMVAPPNGDPVYVYPRKPGHALLSDQMGPAYVVADVYSIYQPLHTTSDLSGHYRVDGVPVGKLEVNVRLKTINKDVIRPVEVIAGVVQKVDITLEYHAPIDAGAAKKVTSPAGPKKPEPPR